MQAALEGLLFISGDDGLSLKEIADILEIEKEKAKELIQNLYNELNDDKRGIALEYLGEKFKLTTKRCHKKYFEKLAKKEQESNLSQSALEVLSIIAYKGPISRVQIDKIRGVGSSYTIRKLVLKNLIEDCGRSEEAGRPILYKVTDQFLNYFGLGSTKDLPEIKETETIQDDKDLFESKYNEDIY